MPTPARAPATTLRPPSRPHEAPGRSHQTAGSNTPLLDLQRRAGNRSVGALLAQPTLGAPGDAAEGRADRAADTVMARLAGHSVPSPTLTAPRSDATIRRDGGAGAGAITPTQASSLERAKTQGRPLDGPVRGELERGFGRSLSAMRVHDGPESHALNRAFSSRAFALDNHLFFGQGAFQPDTARGKRLLSHEIAHGLEGGDGIVRRTYHDAELHKYYSHALAGQVIDETTAVATVTGSSSVSHGGHAFIYLEYLNKDTTTNVLTPVTQKVELRAGGGTLSGSGGSGPSRGAVHGSAASQGYSSGWSGSGSDSANGLRIEMGAAADEDKRHLGKAGRKRSWVTTRAAMEKILAKAKDVSDHITDYTYKLIGRSMFALKKTTNCARFAEKILKAGGLAVSSGWMIKTTSGLTDGANVGYQKDVDYAAVEQRRKDEEAERLRLENERRKAEQLAAEQRLLRFARVATGKLRATFDTNATTLLGRPDGTDGVMQPFTLVTALTHAPGEIQKGGFYVVTEQTKAQGIALLRGQATLADGSHTTSLQVDLDDLIAKTTALAP